VTYIILYLYIHIIYSISNSWTVDMFVDAESCPVIPQVIDDLCGRWEAAPWCRIWSCSDHERFRRRMSKPEMMLDRLGQIRINHKSHCLQERANPCFGSLRFGVALSPRSIVWGCQDNHCGLRRGFVEGPESMVMMNILFIVSVWICVDVHIS